MKYICECGEVIELCKNNCVPMDGRYSGVDAQCNEVFLLVCSNCGLELDQLGNGLGIIQLDS